MRVRLILPLAAALALAGCVVMPTGPAVMAMPGTAKSFDQFRADDFSCREYAQHWLGPGAEQVPTNAAAANAAGGTVLGAATGAIIGSASGQAGPGAAIGAGIGLLFGSLAGADAAGYSYYGLQRRYDAAYLQCMYARGNQVPAGPRYGPRPYGPYYGPPPAG
jgi:OmpA family protein